MEEKKEFTKEEVDNYILNLNQAIGDGEKIDALLGNQEMLLAYLRRINVPEEFLTMSVIEITRKHMKKILKDKSYKAKVKDDGIDFYQAEYDRYARMEVVDGDEFYLQRHVLEENNKAYTKFVKNPKKKVFNYKSELGLNPDEYIEYSDTATKKGPAIGKLINKDGFVAFEQFYMYGKLVNGSLRNFDKGTFTTYSIGQFDGKAYKSETKDLYDPTGMIQGSLRMQRLLDSFPENGDLANYFSRVEEFKSKYPVYAEYLDRTGYNPEEVLQNVEKMHSISNSWKTNHRVNELEQKSNVEIVLENKLESIAYTFSNESTMYKLILEKLMNDKNGVFDIVSELKLKDEEPDFIKETLDFSSIINRTAEEREKLRLRTQKDLTYRMKKYKFGISLEEREKIDYGKFDLFNECQKRADERLSKDKEFAKLSSFDRRVKRLDTIGICGNEIVSNPEMVDDLIGYEGIDIKRIEEIKDEIKLLQAYALIAGAVVKNKECGDALARHFSLYDFGIANVEVTPEDDKSVYAAKKAIREERTIDD